MLLNFAAAPGLDLIIHKRLYGIPYCRFTDILLEMDDHGIHLVDQDAFDLRHIYPVVKETSEMLREMMILHVDGNKYASAALHCMRFLSDPPYVL